MGFLHIPGPSYSRAPPPLCVQALEDRTRPSSFLGRRPLHMAKFINIKFAAWQVFFRTLNSWAPATPIKAARAPRTNQAGASTIDTRTLCRIDAPSDAEASRLPDCENVRTPFRVGHRFSAVFLQAMSRLWYA